MSTGNSENNLVSPDGDNNGSHYLSDQAILDLLANEMAKSKADLVADIEQRLSNALGINVKHAFEVVAGAQQIRGGSMNLNRAHKSALVLLAHVLSKM